MKKLDIAYIAGLVDGEGYIGIKKSRPYECTKRVTPGYHARIQIRMVDESAIRFISETLGGWYYKEKPSAAKGRPLFCYQVSEKNAEEILKILLPYLRIKKESAKTVLDLRKLQSKGWENRTKIIGYRYLDNGRGPAKKIPNLSFSDEYVSQCESLYLTCKRLNKVGV